MPKGALLIINVEFWERFGYFGMLSIFMLFLTTSTSAGGFGWDKRAALGLLGVYAGLMYSLPLFGGFLADRYLGHRAAITLGAMCMTLGHFLLAGSALLPHVWEEASMAVLTASDVPLGSVDLSAEEWRALREAALLGGLSLENVILAYQSITALFWLGIAGLVIGNMLMKSALVIHLGDQFVSADSKREEAYSYYYLAITSGAFLAGLVVGTIGDRIGWQYGFSIAGIGMGIAFISYKLLSTCLVRGGGKPRLLERLTSKQAFAARPRAEIAACFAIVGIAACFLSVFMTGWYQIFGSWILFAQERVDRKIFGFEVPTSWFISFNSIVVMICAPLLARIWLRLEKENPGLGFAEKMCVALGVGALAHGVFAVSAQLDSPSLALPFLGITALSIAELVAWVPAYGFVYRVAPAGLETAVMGWFYLVTLGLSGFLGGLLGRMGEKLGYETFFLYLAVGTLACGTLLLIILPQVKAILGRLKQKPA